MSEAKHEAIAWLRSSQIITPCGPRRFRERAIVGVLGTVALAAGLLFGQMGLDMPFTPAAPQQATSMVASPSESSLELTVNNPWGQRPIPVSTLGVWKSHPGEPKEDFLRRVGVYLHDFAAETGYEACGRIWGNEATQQWVVPLLTAQSHDRCPITSLGTADKAFKPTPETIHVHPSQPSYRVTKADKLLNPHLKNVALNTHRRVGRVDFFSLEDIQGGPGYLVAGGRLMHQRGPGTAVDLGQLDPSIPADVHKGVLEDPRVVVLPVVSETSARAPRPR